MRRFCYWLDSHCFTSNLAQCGRHLKCGKLLAFSNARLASCVVLLVALAPEAFALEDVNAIAGEIEKTQQELFDYTGGFDLTYSRTDSNRLGPKGGLVDCSWRVARRNGMWYIWRVFDSAPTSDKDRDRTKPLLQVVRDREILEWDQYVGSCVVQKFDDGRNAFNAGYFFDFLGVNMYRWICNDAGVAPNTINRPELDFPFLLESLQVNRDKYAVEDVLSPDGSRLLVLEWPGVDHVVLDPSRGMAVIERQLTWGDGKPLRYSIENIDYREVAKGIWLPGMQRVTRYASLRQAESLWGKPINRCKYVLRDARFGDVDESIFDVVLPAGTEVIDMRSEVKYRVVEDGKDPLEGPLGEAEAILKQGNGHLLLWLNVAACVFLAFVVIWRKLRQRDVSS